MAGLLERAGYELAPDAGSADAVIVNSCTVKERTYLDFRKRVKQLGSAPALILAGCVPRVPGQAREFSEFSQVGPDNLSAIPEVVERALAGERVSLTRRAESPRLALPHRRRNPAVEIIPISQGCLGDCTFCQTVLARGRLRSYPEDAILSRVRAAVAEGVRFIWLTSQDCGAYGLDTGSNLPRLLRRVAGVPGDFRVRVGMANPDLVKLYLPEFAEAMSLPPVLKFAHIPVQAGSDTVLGAMGRPYAADDFRRIADALRARVPGITLATDLIAGFPTEDDADFEATLQMVRDTRPPVINRSRYSARPGTRAARLPLLPSSVVSARSKRLYALARDVARAELARLVGSEAECLAEEQPRPGVTMFRTDAYQPVIVTGSHAPGTRRRIRVTGTEGFHAEGLVLQAPSFFPKMPVA